MTRWIYVIGIPALVVLIGGFCFAELVASGFAGDGCRFAPDDASRRAASSREWLLVQGFALVVLSLLGLSLAALLRGPRVAAGLSTAIVSTGVGLGLAGFAVFTLQTWNFLHQCSATQSALLPGAMLAMLSLLIYGCVAGCLVTVVIAYVGGLVGFHPRRSDPPTQ